MADQAERLRELFSGAVPKESKKPAYVITVVSGKGGVGKTSFAVNFAIALSKLDKRVLIIDADFGFSNVDIMLGTKSDHDLGDVMRGACTLADTIKRSDSGGYFSSGGSGMTDLINMTEDRQEYLLSQFSELDDYADIIIFDTGAGIRNSTLRLMESGDEAILVVTPEPTSIMDAFVVVKTSSTLANKPNIRVVINKAATEKDAEKTYEVFCRVVGKYLDYKLDALGYVCKDEEVSRAITSLKPLLENSPNTTASKQLKLMAKRFLEDERFSFNSQGIKGFFSKMLRRK